MPPLALTTLDEVAAAPVGPVALASVAGPWTAARNPQTTHEGHCPNRSDEIPTSDPVHLPTHTEMSSRSGLLPETKPFPAG